jgi:hypothetical protein
MQKRIKNKIIDEIYIDNNHDKQNLVKVKQTNILNLKKKSKKNIDRFKIPKKIKPIKKEIVSIDSKLSNK